MPAVAAIVYLMLALRVRIGLCVSLAGTRGSVKFTAGAAGICLRFDGVIKRQKDSLRPAVVPRYGAASKPSGRKRKKSVRIVRLLVWLSRIGRMERLSFRGRIGLGDAAETAIAAGCIRAAAAALMSVFDGGRTRDLHVAPDFDAAGFCAQLRCIFSCSLGDIMLAAIKAAFEKSRREGLGWKSIPLRA